MNKQKVKLTREDQIKKVMDAKSIFGKKENYFVLSHTYDTSVSLVLLKSKMTNLSMELLVAYLQFKADEIKHAYSFHQTDMEAILVRHFQCEKPPYYPEKWKHIDLYENWEKWCGISGMVDSIHHFKDENVLSDLENLVNRKDTTTE